MSSQTINANQPCYGLTYEVTNEQGVKSYLMGTSHVADKDMVLGAPYLNLIEKCSALYTEPGTNIYVTLPHGSIPEQPHKHSHLQYRFCIDITLTIAAWCKGIPITGLDAYSNEDIDLINKEEVQDKALERMNTNVGSDFITNIAAWKSGDIQRMTDLRKLVEEFNPSLIGEREDEWAKVLIPALKATQKTIGIAVGIVHLVGEDGLQARFQKEGLKVELIKPKFTTPHLYSRL